MKRRSFLSLCAASIWIPRPGLAQSDLRLVGILAPRAAPSPNDEALRAELRRLGYVEGSNIRIDFRGAAGDPRRLDAIAVALVNLSPAVIVALGSEATRAAMKATDRIPIVMGSANPVGMGAVTSLARPGGNVTGVSFMAPEASGKRLELLRELVPGLARLAVFLNPDDPSAAFALESTKQAAGSLAIKLQTINVRRSDDFAPGFAAAVRAGAQAAVLLPAPVATDNAALAARLSLENRIPAIASPVAFARAGGLLSFGTNLPDSYRRIAAYVDKILKGAKPADLPVEQPAKFELVINMSTANALRIKVPQSLLLRADDVIQ